MLSQWFTRIFCGVQPRLWQTTLLLSSAILAQGADPRFYAVDVRVQAQDSPAALVFSWPRVSYAAEYSIRRKPASAPAWGPAIILPGTSTGFTDTSIAAGTACEYEIHLITTEPTPDGGTISAYSYVWAGVDVLERDARGKVILVVDSSVLPDIAAELETFESDLIGAGWQVIRREVPRTASPPQVKSIIQAEYNADPANVRSVILIGHVPVPYSGNIAPDMHSSHRGAWPADAYYAEMDSTWTDESVDVRSEDFPINDNLPGDGKFDQSVLPSPVELELGRIDFWELPAFTGLSEVQLLQRYFRKNHAFRHRHWTAPRQGLVRDNFGDLDGDAPAVDAWRHFGLFFGPDRVREVGPGEFFTTLNTETFLWAYGCGGGANDKADGVGTTADFAANDPRAVFLMLHGSYFGDWNFPDNFLRAAIATPGYTLASVWTGLPHWFMHHMALGETIGYSTRVSQNNLGTYKSYRNFSPGEVHTSLIGDPTLELYPVVPPSNLLASSVGQITLEWSPSPDENILGYHVYHSLSREGPYARLTAQPVTATTFNHAASAGVHYYMIRAVKLEQSGSGTYRNLSQGIFTAVAASSGPISNLPGVTVTMVDADSAEFRANSANVKFTRDIVDGNPLVISFQLSGPAQNGVDYMNTPTTISIEPWKDSAQLLIYPISDSLSEGDEAVHLRLLEGAGYRVVSPSEASFLIRDSIPLNQAPTATPQEIEVFTGLPQPITLTGTDPEGAHLQFTITSAPTKGTLSGTPPKLIYQAGSDATGADSFTFTASDGAFPSAPATISLIIQSRPRIDSLRPLGNGVVIRFTGPPSERFLVEGSSDARNWSHVGETRSTAFGDGEFRDTSIEARLRFYRLELAR